VSDDAIEPLPPIEPSRRTLVVNGRAHSAVVDADHVSIMRPSLWGNPYHNGTRAQNVEAYRSYFYSRILADPAFRAQTYALRGKVLVCCCKPDLCHGDVIAEWLDRYDP
jgi:hypothetical protein